MRGKLAEPPRAVAKKVRQSGLPIREARGFSSKELKAAGIDKVRARKMGLYVDSRRKTEHEENIETIRQVLKNLKIVENQKSAKPNVSKSEK